MYNLLIVTRTTKGPLVVATSVSNHPSYEAAERAFEATESLVLWSEDGFYEIRPVRLYRKV